MDLIVFKTYLNRDVSEDLREIFIDNNIPCEVEISYIHIEAYVSPVDSGNSYYYVKVPKDLIHEANEVLAKAGSNAQSENVFESFSDAELFEILDHKEAWSVDNYEQVKATLIARGFEIDEQAVERENLEREQKALAPVAGDKNIVIAGFVLSFFGCLLPFIVGYISVVAVLAGISIGINYKNNYNTDSKGGKHFFYDEKTRQQGDYIIKAGIISALVGLGIFYFMHFKNL